jgi:hypothetical protein
MGICLAAGVLAATLPLTTFTVAWNHSIEKIRWEEDYRAVAGRLVLEDARIRGSGAGMEPPPDARLEHGIWHYRPHLPPLERLRLTHSRYTAGYELCAGGACRPLTAVLPGLPDYAVVEVTACGTAPAQAAPAGSRPPAPGG